MTPAYNLRLGKAADRILFRELLSRCRTTIDCSQYEYVGLGGPFLEDFRLIRETFQQLRFSSIESKEQVWRRQRFNTPAANIRLYRGSVDDYFSSEYQTDDRVILWLDYTDLNYARLEEIWNVTTKLAPTSILRVSVRCVLSDADEHAARIAWMKDTFGDYCPELSEQPLTQADFPLLCLNGIKRVIDNAMTSVVDRTFQLLSATTYNDGTCMLSITGAIGDALFCRRLRSALRGWYFRAFDWKRVHRIVVPALSMKEIMKLEPHLPSPKGTGKALLRKLGYRVEGSRSDSIDALDSYRRLVEAYPRFVRVAY